MKQMTQKQKTFLESLGIEFNNNEELSIKEASDLIKDRLEELEEAACYYDAENYGDR